MMQSFLSTFQRVSRPATRCVSSNYGRYRSPRFLTTESTARTQTKVPKTAHTTASSKATPQPTSPASVHPTESAQQGPVPILESLTKTYDPAKITQASMQVKLEDLVALPDTFAVVHIGGHQYKVTKGDEIMINKIDVPIQTKLIFDKVLLLGSKEYTVIGQPLLPSAKVVATVEEHDKSTKVIIYKKKRRKTYARKTGHREPYTLLRVADIMGVNQVPM